MLTEVVLQTSDPMSFNIADADPDEILILTSISGLTPSPETLFTGEFSKYGGYYQGRRTAKRNPIFNFKLNPNYAANIEVSSIRELLYRQFYEPQADSDAVQVMLVDSDLPDRYFQCYAETWSGDIFEKSPKAGISTICVDPLIKSVAETSATNVGGWLTVPINYDGSADTGIELVLKVVANTPTIFIENNNQMMTLTGSFLADDIIEIGTVENARYIRLNGADKMVLLTSGPTWITLRAPGNVLRTYGATPGDGLVVATSYKYRSAWRGV